MKVSELIKELEGENPHNDIVVAVDKDVAFFKAIEGVTLETQDQKTMLVIHAG